MLTPGTGAADEPVDVAVGTLARRYAGTFPWYAALLPEAAQAGAVSLAQLPIVDADLLDREYHLGERPDPPGATVHLTSGTATGRRRRVLYSSADRVQYIEHHKRLFGWFLAGLPDTATAVADLGTGLAAATTDQVFTALGMRCHVNPVTSPVDDHVAGLNRRQPDVLFTTPTILEQLWVTPEPLAIAPRKVGLVGDLAPAAWRRRVADRFGIGFEDVLDVFVSTEIGAIAYYCAETDLYHFHDHILPELRPASEPGGGTLLLTSFAREYFAALRFATGDVVNGFQVIRWRGRKVHAFTSIKGRCGDEVKHGARISGHDLRAAINEVFPGASYDVVDNGRLEIRLAVSALTPQQAAAVQQLLLRACPDVAQLVASGLAAKPTVTRVDRAGGVRIAQPARQ